MPDPVPEQTLGECSDRNTCGQSQFHSDCGRGLAKENGRIEERARIVAWLRKKNTGLPEWDDAARDWADAIENGEHNA